MLLLDALHSVGEWFAYSPRIAKAVGGPEEGLLLQYILWRLRDIKGEVPLTSADIERGTGLSKRRQETARASLKAQGLTREVLRGVPATLHFGVEPEAFQLRFNETSQLDSPKPQNQLQRNVVTGCDETSQLASSLKNDQRTTTTAKPKIGPATNEDEKQAAIRIYDAWRQATHRPMAHETEPTPKLIERISAALKEHSERDVTMVARHIARDPWWAGARPDEEYTQGRRPLAASGLMHVLRPEKFKGFLDQAMASAPARPAAPPMRLEAPEDTLSPEEAAELLAGAISRKPSK